MARLYELARAAQRGVLVAGRDERGAPRPAPPSATRTAGEAAAAFGAAAGWPVLADPLSGARRGGAAIAHYDHLLRDRSLAQELRPDLVLRVGDLPTSKPLRGWLAGLSEVAQVALDPAPLFVPSAIPVRAPESFGPARPDPPRVLSNRGANGIDGTISAAFGVAASGADPVVLLIGDVALAHDISGLLAASRLGLRL